MIALVCLTAKANASRSGDPPWSTLLVKQLGLVFSGHSCRLGRCARHPKLTRRDARDALEMPCEMALIREADRGGDLGQGAAIRSRCKQRARAIHSDLQNVLIEGYAQCSFEKARQVEWTQAYSCGDIAEREFVGIVLLNELQRLRHSARLRDVVDDSAAASSPKTPSASSLGPAVK